MSALTDAPEATAFPRERKRPVLLTFDYEGRWGMPFQAPYDLQTATSAILACLARHEARAVFFTVGALATEHPELIERIAADGHEIALHGWRHEHIDRMDRAESTAFRRGIIDAARSVAAVTGRAPIGFRAPFLLSPRFFDRGTYRFLEESGFTWVSNREVRHPIELIRPDRIRTNRPWHLIAGRSRRGDAQRKHAEQGLLLGLNAGLLMQDPIGGSRRAAVRWLSGGLPPFRRGGLLEIPLSSPLDCDLIGFPRPSSPTPSDLLDYAEFALNWTVRSETAVAMLTFHDWIVAEGSRLRLLDNVLAELRAAGSAPRTFRESADAIASRAIQ